MVDPSMVAMVVDVCCCSEAKARMALELNSDPGAAIELVLGQDPRLEQASRHVPAPSAPVAPAPVPTSSGVVSWESMPPGPERAAARAAARKAERAAAAAGSTAPKATAAPLLKPQPEPESEPEPVAAAAPPLGGGYYIKSKKDQDDTFVVPRKQKKQQQKPNQMQVQPATADVAKDVAKAQQSSGSTVVLARSGNIAKRGENRQKKGGVDFKTTNLRVADPSKLLKKGRQMCLCQGMHHRLIGSCGACGLIVCEQIGLGPCLFCDGDGNPQQEYACGVQVEGSKEQLAQLQQERQKEGRRQREARRAGAQGRGRRVGGVAAAQACSDEGVIIKGGRSSVNPDQKLGAPATEATPEELAEKARKAKDKLLEFDRTAAKRTQVIDDQSDWYDASATTLMWLNDEERKKHEQNIIDAELKEKAEREEARKVKLSFDFAGRKILPSSNVPETDSPQGDKFGSTKKNDDDDDADDDDDGGVGTSAYGGGANNLMGSGGGGSGGRSGNSAEITAGSQGGGRGSYSNPFLRGPKPAYTAIISALPDAEPGRESKSSARSRVQDDDGSGETDLDYWRSNIDGAQMSTADADDDEEDISKGKKRIRNVFGTVGGGSYSVDSTNVDSMDSGMCLSMHQPWASLLVAGIKTVEGRGRLWIASTIRDCDPSEAEEMRQEYEERVSRGEQEQLPWPEHFPSSMLLGCIEVTDCIDQDEYRDRCQRGELVDEANGSSYLFVAKDPIQLLVPLRVSGQHKIWKLPAKTSAMARAGLGSQRSLQKHIKNEKKKSSLHLDESNDIALALAASMEDRKRVPGDVGVATNLSVVDLLPAQSPPCAPSVLPHSTDLSQLTVEVLQEGMAIVRGFLSPREQQEIVNTTAALGVGEGGFYIPSYGSRGAQKLFMMNLGWHWNIQSRLYEDRRHDYDSAKPPPIPDRLTAAFKSGLNLVRTQVSDGSIPDTSHDACIVNFYPIGDERVGSTTGRLGVHQDKDEASEVIARGDPIVSLSVGAAANFAYGHDRFEFDERGRPVAIEGGTEPSSVRLESGDLLVFGGKSRLAFHGVAGVDKGTAPSWLHMVPGRLNFTFRNTGHVTGANA